MKLNSLKSHYDTIVRNHFRHIGCAMDNYDFINTRQYKIAEMLHSDDSYYMGTYISPLLKNNHQIYIKVYRKHIELYTHINENYSMKIPIDNLQDFNQDIKKLYSKYYYSKNELKDLLNNSEHKYLKLSLLIFYNSGIPIRNISLDKSSDIFTVYLGSSTISYSITFTGGQNMLCLNVMFYGKGKSIYKSCNRYGSYGDQTTLDLLYSNGLSPSSVLSSNLMFDRTFSKFIECYKNQLK